MTYHLFSGQNSTGKLPLVERCYLPSIYGHGAFINGCPLALYSNSVIKPLDALAS